MNNISIFIILIIAIGLINIDYKLFTVNYNILCILFIFLLALLILSNKKENLSIDNTNMSLLNAIKNGESPEIKLKVISDVEKPNTVLGSSILGNMGLGTKTKFFKEKNFYLTYLKYDKSTINKHSDIYKSNPVSNIDGFDIGVMEGPMSNGANWIFTLSDENKYHISTVINDKTYYLTYVYLPGKNSFEGGDSNDIYTDGNDKAYEVVLKNTEKYTNHGWNLSSKGKKIFEISTNIDGNDFYLYTTAEDNDGKDCKKDQRVNGSKDKCKNVFLVKSIYTGTEIAKKNSQSINPVNWYFDFPDRTSTGKKIERELEISIDDSPSLSEDYIKKPFKVKGVDKHFYITHAYKKHVKIWPDKTENFNPPNGYAHRRLTGTNTHIGVKGNLDITLDTIDNIDERMEKGWACDAYDGNNIVCIKILDNDNPEISLFDTPIGENLLTFKDNCTVELSSHDPNTSKYAFLNKNIGRITSTNMQTNPFITIIFYNTVTVNTIKLKLEEIDELSSNNYKLQLFKSGNALDSPIYESDFNGSNGPVHIFSDLNYDNIRYAKITLTNSNKSVLSLAFTGIYGKENIIEKKCPTFDNSRCRDLQNYNKQKNDEEVESKLQEQKLQIIENTSSKILSYLNKNTSHIEWSNVNEMCKKVKIIIGKEKNNEPIELAISNIIIMGSPNKGNNSFVNYADPKLYQDLKISSVNNNSEYSKENCINQNILTYCKSNFENNPSIEIEFKEDVYVNKILVYNVENSNMDDMENFIKNANIIPCTIQLLNHHNSVILEGYKSDFHSPIIVYGRLPNVNSSCSDLSKIKNYGSSRYLRFMADVEGNTNGKKCNYCRIIPDSYEEDRYRIGCSDFSEDIKYESNKLDKNINLNTLFIHRLDSDKENVCYCKDNNINCLINNPLDDDENAIGFNKTRKFTNLLCNPNDDSHTLMKTVDNYYTTDNVDESYYRIDTGFYNANLDLIFLFKNQKIGKNNHVIYYILKSNLEKKDDTIKARFMMTDNSGEYFRNIPEIFTKELKMAMCIKNIVFFFNKNTLIRYDIISKNIIDKKPSLINDVFNNLDIEVNECTYFNGIAHFFKDDNVYKYEFVEKNDKFKFKGKQKINTIFEDINLININTCVSIEDGLTNNDKHLITKDSIYIDYTENGNKYRKKISRLVDWTLDKSFMYSNDIRTSENVKMYVNQREYLNDSLEYDSINSNNIINNNNKCIKNYPIYPTLSKRYLIEKEKTFENPEKCKITKPIPKLYIMKDIMNFGKLSSYLDAKVDNKRKKLNINSLKDLVCHLNPSNDPNNKYTADNIVKESMNKTFENPNLTAKFFGYKNKKK